MTSPAISTRQILLPLALLWLAGVGLRLTILAPPPVISLIHADLRMTETEVGILSGLPALLFALAAVPGSLLIARFGALMTLIAGLLATAAGSALRGAAPEIWSLYGATVVTGDFVQRPQRQPAAGQAIIDRGYTERQHAGGAPAAVERLNALAQLGESRL